jgi:hypothetical protein
VVERLELIASPRASARSCGRCARLAPPATSTLQEMRGRRSRGRVLTTGLAIQRLPNGGQGQARCGEARAHGQHPELPDDHCLRRGCAGQPRWMVNRSGWPCGSSSVDRGEGSAAKTWQHIASQRHGCVELSAGTSCGHTVERRGSKRSRPAVPQGVPPSRSGLRAPRALLPPVGSFT